MPPPLIRYPRPAIPGKAYLAFDTGTGDRVGIGSNSASELFVAEVTNETDDPRWAVAALRPAGYPHPDKINQPGLIVSELVKRERFAEKAWFVEVAYVSKTMLISGEWIRRVAFSTKTERMEVSLDHPAGMWTDPITGNLEDGRAKLIGSVDYDSVKGAATTNLFVYTKDGKVYLEPTKGFDESGFDRLAGDITFLYRRRIPRLRLSQISALASWRHTTNAVTFLGIFPKWTMFIGNFAIDDGVGGIGEFVDVSDVEVELLWKPVPPGTDLAGGWRIFHRRATWKSDGANDKGKVYPILTANNEPVFDNFVVQEESDFQGFFQILGGPPTI